MKFEYRSVEECAQDLAEVRQLLENVKLLYEQGVPGLSRKEYRRACQALELLNDAPRLREKLRERQSRDGSVSFGFTPEAADYLQKRLSGKEKP